MVLPGPSSILDFPAVPGSIKSTLEGDTIQVPNVAGYFSNLYRQEVNNLYLRSYQKQTWFPFPPLRLNYPPENAFRYIKDQTESTYLEEFTYPLRDSLFVNGIEPFEIDGTKRYPGAIKFEFGGEKMETKTTLRYYPSAILARMIVWAGITASIYLLFVMGRRIIFDD